MLFVQDSYQVSISEDVLPLTSVVTVHAEDADTGDYGQVRNVMLLFQLTIFNLCEPAANINHPS